MPSSLNQEKMARHNRAAVLALIRRTGGISRMELADRLRLARSAVTGIVNHLLQAGIVSQRPLPALRRDEPRSNLVLNPDWGHVVTVALMYDLAVGVVNLAGEVIRREHVRGDGGLTEGHYKADFDRLAPELVGRLVREWSGRNLLGVGVLSCGFVDSQGVIRFNGELPRRNVDMARLLAPVTSLPVYADQELRLLLLWRMWQQERPRWRHVVAFNPGLLGDRGRHALCIDGHCCPKQLLFPALPLAEGIETGLLSNLGLLTSFRPSRRKRQYSAEGAEHNSPRQRLGGGEPSRPEALKGRDMPRKRRVLWPMSRPFRAARGSCTRSLGFAQGCYVPPLRGERQRLQPVPPARFREIVLDKND